MILQLKHHSEKLIHFNHIATHQSFRLAARSAGLSQPALSQSIQTLEQALNASLLIRSHKGIALTSAGERLFEFCKTWLTALDDIELQIQHEQNKTDLSGLLKFASFESLLPSFGIPLTLEAKKQHPHLMIKLFPEKSARAICNLVLNHQADFGLVLEAEKNKNLVTQEAYREHYVFYASSKLKQAKVLSKQKLKDIPLLYFPRAITGDKKLLQERLLDYDIAAKSTDFSTGSYTTLLELASKNYGVVIAPQRVISHSPYAKKLHPIDIQGIPKKLGEYTMQLIFHSNSVHHPQHKKRLDLIQSIVQNQERKNN